MTNTTPLLGKFIILGNMQLIIFFFNTIDKMTCATIFIIALHYVSNGIHALEIEK